jgi:hypothetical protein
MVWMVDPKKAGGLLRAVTDYPLNEQAPAVFAVSATDVLHGGLLELGYIQEPASTPNAPSARSESAAPQPTSLGTPPNAHGEAQRRSGTVLATKASAAAAIPAEPRPTSRSRPVRSKWQLSLGVHGHVPLNHAPVSLLPEVILTRRLGTRFALGMSVKVALPVTVEGTRGKAELDQVWVGPWLEFRQFPGRKITLFEFLETGLAYTNVEGMTSSPLEARETYVYTLYHQAGVGARWNATTDFGLWLRGGILLPWKPVDVVIVQETVARIAGPATLIGAGMLMNF